MPRPYKTKNKCIRHRTSQGRFRKTNLQDIGLSYCEKCKKIFTPDYSKTEQDGFIDPLKFRKCQKLCPKCQQQKGE